MNSLAYNSPLNLSRPSQLTYLVFTDFAMDHFQGITVEVISNGQVLNFFGDPDAAVTDENRARHHYIEVVAGSTFQVKMTLTPEFKFHKMTADDAVQILVDIDGCSSLHVLRTKKYLQEKFSKGKTVEEPFIGPRHFCMRTKQWMLRDYSFSNLILSMLGNFPIK